MGEADIAISGPGGLRGPGWAAGPVKVSDIWAALPFANSLCVATGALPGYNRSTCQVPTLGS